MGTRGPLITLDPNYRIALNRQSRGSSKFLYYGKYIELDGHSVSRYSEEVEGPPIMLTDPRVSQFSRLCWSMIWALVSIDTSAYRGNVPLAPQPRRGRLKLKRAAPIFALVPQPIGIISMVALARTSTPVRLSKLGDSLTLRSSPLLARSI